MSESWCQRQYQNPHLHKDTRVAGGSCLVATEAAVPQILAPGDTPMSILNEPAAQEVWTSAVHPPAVPTWAKNNAWKQPVRGFGGGVPRALQIQRQASLKCSGTPQRREVPSFFLPKVPSG